MPEKNGEHGGIESNNLLSAPTSLAKVHRNIHLSLELLQQDVKKFKSTELMSASSSSNANRLLAVLTKLRQLRQDPPDSVDLQDPESLLQALDVYGTNQSLDQRDVTQLGRLARRLFIFQRMMEAVNERFKATVQNNLYKYCLSFIEETGKEKQQQQQQQQQQQLHQHHQAIYDYEQLINDTKSQIESERRQMRQCESVGSLPQLQMQQYITNHQQVQQLMSTWCDCVQNIVQAAQHWLIYDHSYPKKLQECISQLTKRRAEIKDEMELLESRRANDHNRAMKAERAKTNAEQRLKEYKGERASFASRQRSIAASGQRLQDQLQDTLAARDRHLHKLLDRQQESVRKFLVAAVGQCDTRKQQLERRLAAVNLQISDLERDQSRCDAAIAVAKQQLQQRQQSLQSLLQELAEAKSQEKLLKLEQHNIAQHIRVLQKIREIKLHGDTVRKIHLFGYQPGQYQEVLDPMDELFKEVAPLIADQWRRVYQRLPFDPPREADARERDLETIDISHRRLDAGLSVLAYKSLQKWRRVSYRSATKQQLAETLRQLRFLPPIDADSAANSHR